jgi:acyl transferase domain-containing protein/NAD(P)-dependent dehydrogenase (short-subunit alcohol dehydrogenase family)/acyl carrier protein
MSTVKDATPEPIAIVGMSCRFPGAEDPDALWKMVAERRESVTEYPGGRTPELDAFYRRAGMPDGPASIRGGFLPDIDKFDAGFFEVSPREAEWLDPQQRLLLEASWEALEDAGIPLRVLSREKTGVFIGVWLSEYEHHAKANAPVSEFFLITGGPLFGISSRISFQFDLRGPDISANAACGSSLVAVHLATQSLRSGECSVALAGGVNVQVRHECTQAFSRAKMLSPDGRCKFGAAGADGFVRSDGVGVLVLKRLSDAERDGDNVLALIRGTGMANDGRGSGLLATPSASGQREAMLAAVANSGLDPKTIDYVEAHGTGTRAGDPIELSAISSVFGRPDAPSDPCRTGSVKSNIGHTESAAGIAGIIRVVQAMKKEQFPVSLHAEELNPAIEWSSLGVRLVREEVRWERTDHPRRASVNGLSLTGTNAHVIVEEAPAKAYLNGSQSEAYLLAVSGACNGSIRQRMKAFSDAIGQLPTGAEGRMQLYDFCYTASARRTHLAHRGAVVGDSPAALQRQLESLIGGQDSAGSVGMVEDGRQPKIAFVFPGQGSQWVGMGRELLRSMPAFREAMKELDTAIQLEAGWSVLQQLEDPTFDEKLTRIDVIQPTLFAMEVALAKLWCSWGVVPQAVIGHSMGEVAAACVAGVLTNKDAAAIICRRSKLLMRVAGAGAMVVVDLPYAEAQREIAGAEDKVSVAVSNSPRSTVLAGDPVALDRIVQRLEAEDVFCRWVRVDVASHSPQMDPLKAELLASLAEMKPQSGNIPVCSTVRPGIVASEEMNAGYWVSNLREPVLFARGVEELLKQGFDTFIEMSPHPILVPFVEQTAEAAEIEALAVGSLRREEPETAMLMAAAGRLFANGADLDWSAIYPSGNLTKLPSYPWQRERFWIESNCAKANGFLSTKGHPLIGEPVSTATGEFIWSAPISTETQPWLKDHAVSGTTLLPGSAYVEMAASAGKLIFGDAACILERLILNEAAPLVEGKPLELQIVASPEAHETYAIDFFCRESGNDAWTKTAGCLVRKAIAPATSTEDLRVWEDAEFSLEMTTGHQHAEKLARLGYDFGPAFQQIDWITISGKTALARITPPAEIGREGYRVHPATLDAALQVAARLLIENTDEAETLLPVSIENVTWGELITPGEALYSRAWLNGAPLSGDVQLFDHRGRELLAIKGLVFHRFASDAVSNVDDARFTIAWEPLKLSDEIAKREAVGDWLLIGGDEHEAMLLTSAFASQGASAYVVSTDEFLFSENVENIALRGVIWLEASNLENASSLSETQAVLADGARIVEKVSEIEQRSKSPLRLWMTTVNTQSVKGNEVINVQGASAWGFFSSVSNEYPSLRASSIDLIANETATDFEAIVAIFLSEVGDERIALREGKFYSQRLVRMDRVETDSAGQDASLREGEGFELAQRVPGDLDSFKLVSSPYRAPGHDEVEIEIEAAGLNFRDVLSAMALHKDIQGAHFGGECAGRIVRVGAGVERLKPGDAVLAITPTFDKTGMFASRAIVPAELVFAKPEGMTFAEAAGIPCVFLTAWYALVKLARLQRGERVLIHAAAGGVGLAAIQIAKWVGAEIFATVGSEEKRAHMKQLGVKHIMHSRKLDFAREVMEVTSGAGVDVVLNSLAGPAIATGLESLGKYGRFVEIGKRDILGNSKIGLRPFYRNLSLFAVDLAQSVEDRRAMVGDMFGELMELFEQGVFAPLPIEVFRVSAAGEAFRHMAKGAHIGKIVLQVQGDSAVVRRDCSRLNPEATYLVTGGVGGLGLVAAQALIDGGARHLVLVSRSGVTTKSTAVLRNLEAAGAKAVVRKTDISVPGDVDALLQEIRTTMPPLRGIVHAAGILDDAMVPSLSPAKFETVMAGKVNGALLLDERIKPGELDFLIYYSSVAGVLGNSGQGNYAAANAMLDALAQAQRARGIPAICIDWGTWSEVGLAAVSDNRGARMAHQGLRPLSKTEGAVLLMRILGEAPGRAIAMHFDADAWCRAHPGAKRSELFAKLLSQNSTTGHEGNDFAASLQNLSGEALRVVLVPWLRQQVASVLRLDVERIPFDKPMRALGLDSLMALELRNRLERNLHLKFSATLVWNYPTISAVATYLDERLMGTRNAAPEVAKTIAPIEEAVISTTDADREGTASAADMLEAELLGAEGLLNTLESTN